MPRRHKETNGQEEQNGGTTSSSPKNKRMLALGVALGALGAFTWDALVKSPIQPMMMTASSAYYVNGLNQQQAAASIYYDVPPQRMRTTIRKWGCHRTETPFIFVHIGKAGGGSVRARFAASAANFSKHEKWQANYGSYYPISDNSDERAHFCNSCFSSRRPSNEKSYEGTAWCHAQTPLGRAIACPEHTKKYSRDSFKLYTTQQCGVDSDSCRLVYVGHNWVGAEFHWLPHNYLKNWWNHHHDNNNLQSIPWQLLDPEHIWCEQAQVPRPADANTYKRLYEQCSLPLAARVDALASRALAPTTGVVPSWAPLYASLPVLRVTVLREPFSWLMSQFFWKSYHKVLTCDNVTQALVGDLDPVPRRQHFRLSAPTPGWLTDLCYLQILYLCGEDCATRYASGRATLADLERQAEENLRHGFAVVGLLEEMDDFYDMVDARVQYMDTHNNAGNTDEQQHRTSTKGEALRCKERYKESGFQQELIHKSPELDALVRLYKVGQEVKQFQKEELQQCSPDSFSSKS